MDEHEKQTLQLLLDSVMKDCNLKVMILALYEKHWGIFSRIPASKTGKYHPAVCNLVPYGLINHTLRVVWLVRELYKEEYCFKADYGLKYEQLVAAAFIHDIGKISYHDSDRTSKVDHSITGVQYAEEIGFGGTITDMVLTHMHGWDDHDYHQLSVADQTCARVLAYADYLSAQRDIDFPTLATFGEMVENVKKRGTLDGV